MPRVVVPGEVGGAQPAARVELGEAAVVVAAGQLHLPHLLSALLRVEMQGQQGGQQQTLSLLLLEEEALLPPLRCLLLPARHHLQHQLSFLRSLPHSAPPAAEAQTEMRYAPMATKDETRAPPAKGRLDAAVVHLLTHHCSGGDRCSPHGRVATPQRQRGRQLLPLLALTPAMRPPAQGRLFPPVPCRPDTLRIRLGQHLLDACSLPMAAQPHRPGFCLQAVTVLLDGLSLDRSSRRLLTGERQPEAKRGGEDARSVQLRDARHLLLRVRMAAVRCCQCWKTEANAAAASRAACSAAVSSSR